MKILDRAKFILLSIVGVIFFLVPYEVNDNSTISISHISTFIKGNMLNGLLLFTQVFAIFVIILTTIFIFYTSKSDYLNKMFKASPLNVFARIVGSALYVIVLQQLFNEITFFALINDPATGQVMAGDEGLLTTLYITFFVGILALPLLTHFGLVEFVGTLIAPFVRKIFRVPGYSAIDAIASFVGDGTIGIFVTDTQYQRGYYTKREAYIIATSFSIVGVAFAAAVAEELSLSNIFPVFYGSIALVTIIIAIVTSRLPLKKFPNEYYHEATPHKEISYKGRVFKEAFNLATLQASKANFGKIFKNSLTHVLNIYVGFLPIIMLVGTTGLVIAEMTSVFDIISAPLVPIYELFGFTNEVSSLMAPATIVGFADMYLPAIFIKGASSEVARFVIGVLAFTQLVFMSETGMVLVKSKIGLNFLDIMKVFAYRTLLSFPIVMGIAYILVQLGILSW